MAHAPLFIILHYFVIVKILSIFIKVINKEIIIKNVIVDLLIFNKAEDDKNALSGDVV